VIDHGVIGYRLHFMWIIKKIRPRKYEVSTHNILLIREKKIVLTK